MKKAIYLFLFSVQIIALSACSADDGEVDIPERPSPAVAEQLNEISYGSDEEQVYDLYLPENRDTETKIIVLVHGGGYTSGDKSDMFAYQEFLKQEIPEVAVANMNYRLADSDNAPYPMQIDDLTEVVADLKDKRVEYQVSDDIGFVGISAGGHLSLLWSYAFDIDNQVNMVCSIVGPTNFLDDAYRNTDDPVLLEIKNNFNDDPDFLREVSPLFQATATSPPTILFYGGQDPLIPNSQGIDLDARLTELEVPHEFTFYEEEGHGWTGLNLFDTSEKLTSFIEEHL